MPFPNHPAQAPARMANPVSVFPDALRAMTELKAAVDASGLAPATRHLVRLRASQINGSSSCIHAASKQARDAGETDVRLLGVTAWRESPYYTDAERAALELTEFVTRLTGTAPVPDDVWAAASRHFDDHHMAALLLTIAITNGDNRFSLSTRQVAGT
jgi:AhpD family alkylhydroperoxidase